MPASVQIKIPRDMKPDTVAETFTAYLIGSLVFDRGPHARRDSDGPFQQTAGDGLNWQLDGSNDFWLHIDESGETAKLNCRYDGWGTIIVESMANLFEARYVRL